MTDSFGKIDEFDGLAEVVLAQPTVRLGDLIPGLWEVANEPVNFDRLNARVASRLRIAGTVTWGDVAKHTAMTVLAIPGAGDLTVRRLVNSARQAAADGPSFVAPIEPPEVVSPQEQIGSELLDALRAIAGWAHRERGATRLRDLIQPLPQIGAIPRELVDQWNAVADVALIEHVPDSSLDPKLVDRMLERLAGSEPDKFARNRAVVLHRVLPDPPTATFAEIGDQYGVSRERIRQLEVKIAAEADEIAADPEFAPLRWRAEDLRRRIGVFVRERSTLVHDAMRVAANGLDGERMLIDALMLRMAGPYERRDGWLCVDGFTFERVVEVARSTCGDAPLIELETLHNALIDQGLTIDALDEVIAHLDVRQFDQQVAWWPNNVGVKARAVLAASKAPMTVDAIFDVIDEEYSKVTITNAMSADDSVMRTTKDLWALRSWGLPEYSGIVAAMAECIERHGGAASINTIIEDLAQQDIKEGSIRSYAQTPAFVRKSGLVRVRRDDEPYEMPTDLAGTNAEWVDDHTIVWRIKFDRDLQRGSGKAVLPGLAGCLGAHPGKSVSFAADQTDRAVRVAWTSGSISPQIGALRLECEAAQAEIGDLLRVTFDLAQNTVQVEREAMH